MIISQHNIFVGSMLLFQDPAVYEPDVLVTLEHVKRCLLDRGARVRPLCPFPTDHPAGVFFCREERYNRVIYLIRRCRLLTHGARVMSLCRFPPAHPVMCAMLLHACFAMMCVAHKPLGFWRHQHFCVFCVYDLHQPLGVDTNP